MNDRASKEKKTNTLLAEWRDEKLSECDEEVLHLYCMAHVLLGFHSYIANDLKDFENRLTKTHGPLGRHQMEIFKFWGKK